MKDYYELDEDLDVCVICTGKEKNKCMTCKHRKDLKKTVVNASRNFMENLRS